jgi:hypothetical protein
LATRPPRLPPRGTAVEDSRPCYLLVVMVYRSTRPQTECGRHSINMIVYIIDHRYRLQDAESHHFSAAATTTPSWNRHCSKATLRSPMKHTVLCYVNTYFTWKFIIRWTWNSTDDHLHQYSDHHPCTVVLLSSTSTPDQRHDVNGNRSKGKKNVNRKESAIAWALRILLSAFGVLCLCLLYLGFGRIQGSRSGWV